jgi:hypothetical protein
MENQVSATYKKIEKGDVIFQAPEEEWVVLKGNDIIAVFEDYEKMFEMVMGNPLYRYIKRKTVDNISAKEYMFKQQNYKTKEKNEIIIGIKNR